MAKASVKIVCKTCGCEFRHEKVCTNRAAADSYEAWAQENITICPKCWAETKQEEEGQKRDAVAAELNLPQITEGSEKQIAWAEKIRAEYIADKKTSAQAIELRLEKSGTSLEAKGITPTQLLLSLMDDPISQIMLTSTNAKEIIDNR